MKLLLLIPLIFLGCATGSDGRQHFDPNAAAQAADTVARLWTQARATPAPVEDAEAP